MFVLLLSMMILVCNVTSTFASTLTNEVPDFEQYALNEGVDVSDYNFYNIFYYDNHNYNGQVASRYSCFFVNSVTHFYELDGSLDGDASYADTAIYRGTYDNPVVVHVWLDINGNVLGYSVEKIDNGRLYFYFLSDVIHLYSNFNLLLKKNDGSIETVFHVAPLLQGQKVTIGTTMSHQQLLQPLLKQIVSLIPCLIGFLVLAIGLRKAFLMLLVRLHQA